MGLFDRILNTGTPTEWVPAKGETVVLKHASQTIWPELEGVEGKIHLVEKLKPPHKPEPTGRLEVVFVHNGLERTLCGPSSLFELLGKLSKPEESEANG